MCTSHDFIPRTPSSDEIEAIRDARGCGLIDAREYAVWAELLRTMHNVQAHGTLEEKVDWLFDRMRTQIMHGIYPTT